MAPWDAPAKNSRPLRGTYRKSLLDRGFQGSVLDPEGFGMDALEVIWDSGQSIEVDLTGQSPSFPQFTSLLWGDCFPNLRPQPFWQKSMVPPCMAASSLSRDDVLSLIDHHVRPMRTSCAACRLETHRWKWWIRPPWQGVLRGAPWLPQLRQKPP